MRLNIKIWRRERPRVRKTHKGVFGMKKNLWKLLEITALAAVIGLGLAGCKDEAPEVTGPLFPAEFVGTWDHDDKLCGLNSPMPEAVVLILIGTPNMI
jgi:hypothetical protein